MVLLCILPLTTAVAQQPSQQPAPAQSTTAKKIQLRVWGLPTRDQAVNPDAKATLAIADEYRRNHPNVELLPFEGLNVEGIGSMDSGPLMAMAGGVAPEVLYVNFRISETFISQGFLAPLDDYVAQWRKEQGTDLDKLIPKQIWEVIKRKGPPDGKQHIYAIPYGIVVMALMYRKDVFKEHGLDPNKPPQNWDEMYDYAMRMSDPKNGAFGLGLYSKMDAAWQFMSFLWSAGSNAVVQDPNGDWRAAYDDDGAVKAVDYYWKLRRGPWTRCPYPNCNEPVAFPRGATEAKCKNGHTVTVEQAKATDTYYEGVVDIDPFDTQDWDRGKVGMVFQYLQDQFIAQVNPSQTGIAPVPAGPTGIRGSEINSTMYGLNSTIKDPAVRDAAWDYIKFTGSKDARKIKTDVFVQAGFAKYVNPEWLNEFGYLEYVRDVPPGWADVLSEAIRDSKPEPYGKNCQLIYREMQIPLDTVVNLANPDPETIRGILKHDVEATNEKLLGRLPPAVKTFRDRVTLVAVILIGLAFGLMLKVSLGQYSTQIKSQSSAAVTDTVGGAKRRKIIYAWLVMAPALLSIAIWYYYPLIRGSVMAFQDYKILLPTRWVGVDNFAQAFFSVEFWQTMLRTAEYAGASLALGFFAPIFLALFLHEVPRGKVMFRTLYYLPAVTTGVVIYMLWRLFYDAGPSGLLNQIVLAIGNLHRMRFANPVGVGAILAVILAAVLLVAGPSWLTLRPRKDGRLAPSWAISLVTLWDMIVVVGAASILLGLGGGVSLAPGAPTIAAQKWLQSPKQAMLCIIFSQIWAGIGPGCIIYLAAMRAIPEELYEAADLDGASFWGKFRRITIPYLKPLIIINFVGAFIGASRSFDAIFVMTGGGPAQATTVLGLDIWYNAFVYLKYGLAVSMAWVLGSLLIGFTVMQLRILSRLQFRTAAAK
jgi:multiple sugar transport system permease protein